MTCYSAWSVVLCSSRPRKRIQALIFNSTRIYEAPAGAWGTVGKQTHAWILSVCWGHIHRELRGEGCAVGRRLPRTSTAVVMTVLGPEHATAYRGQQVMETHQTATSRRPTVSAVAQVTFSSSVGGQKGVVGTVAKDNNIYLHLLSPSLP